MIAMLVLELDPNVVKPGWTPLLVTIAIGLVMVLLYRSMRRQFKRVDAFYPEPAAPVGEGEPDAEEPPTSAPLTDPDASGSQPPGASDEPVRRG